MIHVAAYSPTLERRSWWFRGRRAIVEPHVRRQVQALGLEMPDILDLGCGSGGNLNMLAKYGRVSGIDIDPAAVALCGPYATTGDATNLPHKDASWDLIVALDVFEHIEDDLQAFREVRRVLRPNGSLVLTVPAHPSLWSRHDEALGHFRRYTASDLRDKLRGAGFAILTLRPAIAAPYPPLALWRQWERLTRRDSAPSAREGLRDQPGPINTTMLAALQVEAMASHLVPMPFGLSLLAVAQPN